MLGFPGSKSSAFILALLMSVVVLCMAGPASAVTIADDVDPAVRPMFVVVTDDVFRTQTQGGWGTRASGDNPGAYRDANFDVAFPDGVTIGCDDGGYNAPFTSSAAVQKFLPQGKKPGALQKDYVDPSRTTGGVFAGQVLALSLNVGFDVYDPAFSESYTPFGTLVVAMGPCEYMTVAEVLALANQVLGGCSTGMSPSTLNDCVTAINESWVDGVKCSDYLVVP